MWEKGEKGGPKGKGCKMEEKGRIRREGVGNGREGRSIRKGVNKTGWGRKWKRKGSHRENKGNGKKG